MKNPLWLLAVGASFLVVAGCTINVPPNLAAALYGQPDETEPQEAPPPQVVEVVREVVREVMVPVEPVVEKVVNNYYPDPEPVYDVVVVHEPKPRRRPRRHHRPRYHPRPKPPRRCWPPLVVIKPGRGHGGHGGHGGGRGGRGGRGGEGERGGRGGRGGREGGRGGRGGEGGEGERGKPKPEWKGKTKHTSGDPVPRPPSMYADNGG